MKKVLAIIGPTAIGKTTVGIELARKLNGEIVSCDSRQIYKLMDIGTAKPTKEEQAQTVHHLIDIVYPDERFSAGLYEKRTTEVINDIFNRQKLPIIVGGSGLYLRALESGFLEEVKNLITKNYSFQLPALRTFGYLDMEAYLQGKISLGRALEKFKQGTRNYAKRQLH